MSKMLFKSFLSWPLAGEHSALFTGRALQQKATELQQAMMGKLLLRIADAQQSGTPALSAELSKAASRLAELKASSGRLGSWRSRAGVASRKGCGASGQASTGALAAHRAHLHKKAASAALERLVSSYEPGSPCRSGLSRPNQPAKARAGHALRKGRLSALLSAPASGSKLPLSIIGPSKRPRSSPRQCSLLAERSVLCYNQASSWMTRGPWPTIARGMGKPLVSIVGNCSPHDAGEGAAGCTPALPRLSMTSELQPVDLGVGRSFKAAHLRLFVAKVIKCVDEMADAQAAGRAAPKLSLLQIVASWAGARMIAEAWGIAPKPAALSAWIK